MQLSPAKFNAWLNKIGQDMYWRPAVACPCINPGSGAARTDCPLCHGKKYQWGAEQPARCGFQNQTQKQTIAQFGVWAPGDATLTIGSDSPMYASGPFDRFRCKNATSPFTMIRVKGDQDFLLGSVVNISRVFWLNAAGTAEIEGGIPTVDAEGNLSWPAGQAAPPDDTAYSVTGVKYDEYYAYPDIANDRNMQAGSSLPKKLLARRFDLFGR